MQSIRFTLLFSVSRIQYVLSEPHHLVSKEIKKLGLFISALIILWNYVNILVKCMLSNLDITKSDLIFR